MGLYGPVAGAVGLHVEHDGEGVAGEKRMLRFEREGQLQRLHPFLRVASRSSDHCKHRMLNGVLCLVILEDYIAIIRASVPCLVICDINTVVFGASEVVPAKTDRV